jgi:enoyl-CoA hydratase/carnithine racemase
LKLLQTEEFRKSCKDVNFTNYLHQQQYFHWFYKTRIEKAVEKNISQWIFEGGNICRMIRSTNMNALTLEMVESISMCLKGKKAFVLCGERSEFSVGDDYLWLYNNPKSLKKYSAEKAKCLLKLKGSNSLSVMRGTCMGTGAALALACRYRVATPSSVLCFPENTYGISVDCSTLFALTSLPTGLALFLALTGSSIHGPDLIHTRLATHFVRDEDVEKFIKECENVEDFEQVLHKFAYNPLLAGVKSPFDLQRNADEIEKVFGRITSVEGLYEKLSELENNFRNNVANMLNSQCPLSLFVTLKAFHRCKGKTFEECVELGYNLNVQLMQVENGNFSLAVIQKLIQKTKVNPSWFPDHHSLVTPGMVNPLFSTLDIPTDGN